MKKDLTICIIGAGTMGSGIAQAAAQGGFRTILYDIDVAMLDKAKNNILKSLRFLVEKEKITEWESVAIFQRLLFVNVLDGCVAGIFIEAIIEKMEAKVDIFNQLSVINPANTIFASNTSSLSISTLQKIIPHPERVAGMHFFNPAQIMKLVEVVKGEQTSNDTVQAIYDFCIQLNKTPVLCSDAPGFIVNRVARHYYLEAMKLVEKGIATFENVDAVMEATGFKMGPFRLMDLIGMDVNLAVSQSLYDAFNKEARLEPSPLQADKVAKGELGRKTGKGFYEY